LRCHSYHCLSFLHAPQKRVMLSCLTFWLDICFDSQTNSIG
jgi:hypothetical protein